MAVFSVEGCEWNAYFDESYGNADAYAVAGYVAPVEQWAELVREWTELGGQEGFTVLHKRLLEHNIPGSEFEWPELNKEQKAAKKRRINSRACGIIKRRVNAGFAAAVTKSVWDKQVKASRWAKSLGESFYAAGVYMCLNLVSLWAEEFNRTSPILYILENGAQGKEEARQLIEELNSTPHLRKRHLICDYKFEDKKHPDFVPLQAADFLAYESYRQLDNRVREGVKRPERGALSCLLYRDDPKYTHTHSAHLPTPLWAVHMDEEKTELMLNGLDENFPLGPAFLNG